jgi:hypothetical protein
MRMILATALFLAASPAAGQTRMLESFDPEAVVRLLDGHGLRGTIVSDEYGQTQIEVPAGKRLRARGMQVYFLGCEDNASCTHLQFLTVYDPSPMVLEFVNTWNRERIWTKAYYHDEAELVFLEMDINAAGGIGEGALDELTNIYLTEVSTFADELRNPLGGE